MAEFRLNARETRILNEAIEIGISTDRRKGVSKPKAIARLLRQLAKLQGNDLISLELPDKEDV